MNENLKYGIGVYVNGWNCKTLFVEFIRLFNVKTYRPLKHPKSIRVEFSFNEEDAYNSYMQTLREGVDLNLVRIVRYCIPQEC